MGGQFRAGWTWGLETRPLHTLGKCLGLKLSHCTFYPAMATGFGVRGAVPAGSRPLTIQSNDLSTGVSKGTYRTILERHTRLPRVQDEAAAGGMSGPAVGGLAAHAGPSPPCRACFLWPSPSWASRASRSLFRTCMPGLVLGGSRGSMPRILWICWNASMRRACCALAVRSSRSWGVMDPRVSTGSLSQGSWSPGPSLVGEAGVAKKERAPS